MEVSQHPDAVGAPGDAVEVAAQIPSTSSSGASGKAARSIHDGAYRSRGPMTESDTSSLSQLALDQQLHASLKVGTGHMAEPFFACTWLSMCAKSCPGPHLTTINPAAGHPGPGSCEEAASSRR